MKTVYLNEGGHLWRKQNSFTIIKGRTNYDIMKCDYCGLQGKTNSISTISLKSTYKIDKILKCPGSPAAPSISQGKEFKVIKSNWPQHLPDGTIIVFVKEDSKGKKWYKRRDIAGSFLDSEDGTFVQFENEIEPFNPQHQ